MRHDGRYGAGIAWSIEFDEEGEVVAIQQSGENSDDEDNGGPLNGGNTPDDYDPTRDDPRWPGQFAVPGREQASLVLNIRYDSFPSETFWSWEKLMSPGASDTILTSWETRDSGTGAANQLSSYFQEVDSGLYRLRVDDSQNDGSCCLFGFGYFTITDSTHVVWQGLGDFEHQLDVYIWVNGEGIAQHVRPINVPGVGSVVVIEDDDNTAGSVSMTASATITLVPEY